MATYICPQCGEEYRRSPAQVARVKRSFCGEKCFREAETYPYENVETRFWEKVNKQSGYIAPNMDTECWEWTAQIGVPGYGVISYKGRPFRAHRLSWIIHYGEVQKGLWVLHRCDNRKCIRPDHLFLGTPQDNADDMRGKGRGVYQGRKNHRKFTPEQVREIRKSYSGGERLISIARRYGYNKSQIILNIINGKNYKHVD